MKYFQTIRLKNKFLVVYSLIITLSLSMSGGSIYIFVKSLIKSDIENKLSLSTTSIVNLVKNTAETSIKTLLRTIAEKSKENITMLYTQYKNGIITENQAKERAIATLLSQTIGKTGFIYCIDSKGIVKVHPKPEWLNTSHIEEDYIQEQIKLKQGDYSYNDNSKKGESVCYMSYFEPWDWIISASAYRSELNNIMYLDDLKKIIVSMTFGKSGYPYIIDSKGSLVIHPKLTKGANVYESQDSTGRYFIKTICTMKNGTIIYPWKNPDETHAREKICIFQYLPEYDWIVASSAYLEEIYRPLKRLEFILFIIFLITLIIILLATHLMMERIIKPIIDLSKAAEKIAEYDLTVQICNQRNDEIGNLGHAMEKTLSQFRKIIGEAKKSSQGLSKTSTQLVDISSDLVCIYNESNRQTNMVASASEEITTNLNTIASTTLQMTVNVQEVHKRIEKVSQSINQVTSSIEKMSGSMNNVRDNADQGARIAKEAMHQAIVVKDAMTILKESAVEIDDVTIAIKRISDKTNLLALNASIEAASAGESGKGFAVVANAIQKFADQSTEAAEDIALRILQVQEKTDSAFRSISKITDIIEHMNKASETIRTVIDEQSQATNQILSNTLNIDAIFSDIVIAMNELESGAKDVNIRLSETSEGAIQVSKNIQHVSQATESSNQSITKVNEIADLLNRLSNTYKHTVEIFKI